MPLRNLTNKFDKDNPNPIIGPVYRSPSPPSYDEPRKSTRLMGKNSKNIAKEKEFGIDDDIEADNVRPRPVKLQLHKLSKTLTKVIEDCADLALRSHVLQHSDYDHEYGRPCVREVREVRKARVRGGADYWIIFRGRTSNGVEVFEGVVFQDLVQRKVIRTRTLEPYKDEWYFGNFCVPLTSITMDSSSDVIAKPTSLDVPTPMHITSLDVPTPMHITSLDVPTPMHIDSSSADVIAKPRSLGVPTPMHIDSSADVITKPTSLGVPTPMHIDSSSADVIAKPAISDLARKRSYSLNDQAKETSNQNGQAVDVKTAVLPKPTSRMKRLGQGVKKKYVLHELGKSHRRIFEECAALMMQDYAIQVFTKGLRFIKLVEVESSVLSSGGYYTIVFEGATDMNGVATFAGTVWDSKSMRQVMRVRTLKPRLGKWYIGNLVIPSRKGLDLSQFEPSAC